MVEMTEQILADNNNSELILQIDKEICSKCFYAQRTSTVARSTCGYSDEMNRSRPCHWTDCVKTGVFRPKKGIRKGTWERLYKRYGVNDGKE